VDGPGPFYTLDPVLVAAGVGVLAGIALLATGVMVLDEVVVGIAWECQGVEPERVDRGLGLGELEPAHVAHRHPDVAPARIDLDHGAERVVVIA